jgi:Arc/MetJ family transcription regulator
MRTTIDIPQDLLAHVIQFSHAKTKREAVVTALREYVDRQAREAFIAMRGTGFLDLTQEDLQRMRADD